MKDHDMDSHMNGSEFDWSSLAFGSKRALKDLKAIFIIAPRELSKERFLQLVKQYLPQGNLLLGIAKEDYIDGFAGQPHFQTLRAATVQPVIAKVNSSASRHKIYLLHYFQREADYIIQKVPYKRVVLVNGSWQHTFHNRSTYYTLANNHIAYDMVSPFASEAEAKQYELDKQPLILASLDIPQPGDICTTEQMLQGAKESAKQSYDYSFQTGVMLGILNKADQGKPDVHTSSNSTGINDYIDDHGDYYTVLASSFNRVVPYQTYAMHHGASREQHFSPPHDLNYYDTVHAEAMLIIQVIKAAEGTGSAKSPIDLRRSTVFINLLPCRQCARLLGETGITELVYQEDHSNGEAIKILEQAGKVVRRVAP